MELTEQAKVANSLCEDLNEVFVRHINALSSVYDGHQDLFEYKEEFKALMMGATRFIAMQLYAHHKVTDHLMVEDTYLMIRSNLKDLDNKMNAAEHL